MASLKAGKWTISSNGHPGVMNIGSISSAGNLENSNAFGDKITGFWDEGSRKLTFIRIVDASDPSKQQIYTGYLLNDMKNIAGSFEAFQGTGGSAGRPVYGWLASVP